MAQQYDEQLKLPEQKGVPAATRFDWDTLSVDDRVARAERRAHIKCEFENMEPTMTKSAFDFYGCYVKISEPQKYKYAENKVILYYKDLIGELLKSNETLRGNVDNMIAINQKYEFNEEEVKAVIA